ncbi:hypothetical protein TWF481_006415 [Arthrobotrys musiformis]|uniref:NACHT domain-containing protein n=1 Tax=Arthrobotrys musiformis TaxID=47236 RepID=A0AAV9WHS2_9PEZI
MIASEIAAHQAVQSAALYQQSGYVHREFEVQQWAGNRAWQIQQDFAAKKRRLNRILEKISGFDHTRSFINARDRRYPNTGSWLFTLPEFESWDRARDSSVLWYHGIPGSGKSILATAVIDHLFNCHQNTKASIIYFFCDFHTPETLRYRTILSSLLKQVIVLNGTLSNQAQDELEISYLESHLPPDIYELEELFVKFTGTIDQLYILIDGIDECSLEERLDVLAFIKRFIGKKPEHKKFMLSSRPDIDLPRSLPISHNISLSRTGRRLDVEAYIDHELETKCPNLKAYPREVKDDIRKALSDGADGMFLWVFFQIQDIRRAGNREKIYSLLRGLPNGLSETYERIIRRIHEERDSHEAAMTFKWLSECRRPLTLMELRDAIAIRVGDTQHAQIRMRYNDDPEGIIQNCGGLVIKNEQDQTVQYAHSTVSKYLQSRTDDGSPEEASIDTAQLCATYLQLRDFGTQLARIKKKVEVVSEPKDWITILLPVKLKFLDPICRSAFDMVSGSRQAPISTARRENPIEVFARSACDTPKSDTETKFMSSFPCLKYIAEYWLHHFGLDGARKLDRARHLEALLDALDLPFPFLPGMKGGVKPDFNELLSWACEQDNLPLFAVLFFKSRGDSGSRLQSQAIGRVRVLAIEGGVTDIAVLLNYAIEKDSPNVVRYILEDSPVTLERGLLQIRHTLGGPVPNSIYQWMCWRYLDPRTFCQSSPEIAWDRSPLQTAARFCRLQIFDSLLKEHLRLGITLRIGCDKFFDGAMDEATLNGSLDIVKLMLEKHKLLGWHYNTPDQLRRFFSQATRRGHQEVVQYIISRVVCPQDGVFPMLRDAILIGCPEDDTKTSDEPNNDRYFPRWLSRGPETSSGSNYLRHFNSDDDPFAEAVKHNYLEILKILVDEAGRGMEAHFNMPQIKKNFVFVPAFCRAIECENTQALQILDKFGYSVLFDKMQCRCGKYFIDFMHEAIRLGKLKSVRWLFEQRDYARYEVLEYLKTADAFGHADIKDFWTDSRRSKGW